MSMQKNSAWPPLQEFTLCTNLHESLAFVGVAVAQDMGRLLLKSVKAEKSLFYFGCIVAFQTVFFQSFKYVDHHNAGVSNLKKHNQGPHASFNYIIALTNTMICKYKQELARQGTSTM